MMGIVEILVALELIFLPSDIKFAIAIALFIGWCYAAAIMLFRLYKR